MRRRNMTAGLALTVLTVLVVPAPPARANVTYAASYANRHYPSKNDVRRAQQHSAAVKSQVSGLEAQLTAASAKADAADLALSSAAEDFDSARIELADSQRAAKIAADVAGLAGQRLAGARQQVGELAAQSYRTGGPLASLDVLFSPSGPGDVMERASMIHTLAEQRQHTVHRMDAARVVATTLDTQAAEALARQIAAANKLAAARAVAQQRATAAQSILAAEKTTRAGLLVKLAAAQKTTVTVERARQVGLQQAAEARREAEQRAAAQRRRPAAAPIPGPGNGNGSPGAGSGGSGSGGNGSGGGNDSGGGDGSGGATDPGAGSGSSSGSSSGADAAVSWAKQRVGLPYQWGGAGPGSYDCSGLVMRAWGQAGVGLPHSSRAQYQQVEKISYSGLRPGDLVFFATDPSNPDTIHHVAMYLGGGQMIEAPYTGANVRIVALRSDDEMPYAGRP